MGPDWQMRPAVVTPRQNLIRAQGYHRCFHPCFVLYHGGNLFLCGFCMQNKYGFANPGGGRINAIQSVAYDFMTVIFFYFFLIDRIRCLDSLLPACEQPAPESA